MKKLLLCAALAGLPIAAQASIDEFFASIDADQDGLVSPQEALKVDCLARRYGEIPRQSERGLSRAEFEQAIQTYCTRDEAPSRERGGHRRPRH